MKQYILIFLFILYQLAEGVGGGYSFAQTSKDLDAKRLEKQLSTINYLPQISNLPAGQVGLKSQFSILPPDPEQDCPFAIPVCQDTFVQPNSYVGFGNDQEIPGNTCLGENEKNSVWYILNIQSGGDLEFVITPFDLNDDYDWALYNLTGNNCSAISNGSITPDRCNYCVDPGPTGLSASGTNAWEDCCSNSPGCEWSTILPVTTGETFVLIISNFSSTPSGYTLDFSPSTAVIFDTIPPTPDQFTTVCGGDSLTLTLSEPVLCSSIALDGSDIIISGPGGPYTVTGTIGANCGAFSTQITVYFNPPLIIDSIYTITITTGSDGNTLIDNCGNEMTDPTILIYIAQPPPVTIAGDNDICQGSSTTLTASSGTSYSWNTSAATQSITVSPATTTTYSVTVTNGTCSGNASITVTVQDAPVAGFTFSPNPVCVGQQVDFTNSSSFPGCFFPFLFYSWNFGDGSLPDISQDPSHTYSDTGTYTVSLNVIDLFCGCDNIFTQTITVITCSPCVMTVSTGFADETCTASDGTATATPSGGTMPYTFLWDANTGSQTTATATGLSAGTYTVIVTDSSGCADTASVTVNSNSGTLSVTTSQADVSCNGACDGTVTAIPSGGTSPYSYLWDDPCAQTTQTILFFCGCVSVPGTYTVAVTDSNGCSASSSVALTEPPPITFSLTSTPASCGGSDGTATVSASGGTGSYTYAWSPIGGIDSTANNLPAGTYSVMVTDSNGCVNSDSVTIMANSLPNVDAGNDTAICVGQCVTLSASGAASYTWSPGVGLSDSTIANPIACPVTTTMYYVTGSVSGNNLIFNGDFELGDVGFTTDYTYGSASPGFYFVDTDPSVYNGAHSGSDHTSGTGNFLIVDGSTSSNINVWCQTVSVTPGTDYFFSAWVSNILIISSNFPDPILQFTINGNPLCGSVTLPELPDLWVEISCTWNSGLDTTVEICISSLSTVSIGNDFGVDDISFSSASCSNLDSVTVFINPSPITLSLTSTPASCGGSDGTATVNASGGTGAYTYAWSPIGGIDSTANNLPAGTYSVMVTDGNGCAQTDSIVVVNTGGPAASIISFTNVSCFGGNDGTAIVSVTGGTTPYTYFWSPSGGSNDTAAGLSAGLYAIMVTDAGGCISTASIAITEPGAIMLSTVVTNVSCNGVCNGTIDLTVTGGVSAYNYTWTPGGQVSQDIINLCVGTYCVTVTDANLCDTTICVVITEPPPITLSLSSTQSICGGSDGTATAAIDSGGTPPYAFLWSPGGGTNATATGLSGGIYTVNVTDANGCIAVDSINVSESSSITIGIISTSPLCNGGCGGSATVTAASGGTPPYAYSWNTSPVQNTLTATGLCSATYTVTVSDASCSPSGNELVANGNFSAGNVGFTSDYFYCNTGGCLGPEGGYGVGTNASFYNGGFTGSDNTTGSGNFMVVNGSGTPNSNVWCQTITVTPNTNYVFSTWVSSVNASSPAQLQFSINGVNLGSIFSAPSSTGVWIQFFITWNSGASTTATICIVNQNTTLGGNDFGLDDISFQECISVCPATANVIITEPPALSFTTSQTGVSCFGGNDGSASVTVSGGTTPYTYLWAPNVSSSDSAGNLSSGNYSIAVTDANGCSDSTSITVSEPSQLTLNFASFDAECFSICDGFAIVIPNGGVLPYTYLWSPPPGNGQGTPNATAICSGSYNLTVTDSNACFTDTAFVVNEPADFIISTSFTSANCGQPDGDAAVTVSGATSPYNYLWDISANSQTTPVATGLAPGTYFVTITDSNICDTIVAVTVGDIPGVVASAVSMPATCEGDCDGSATVTTNGGTSPYIYQWNDPNNQTGSTATGLCPDIYLAIITDGNGCSDTASVTVVANPSPVADFEFEPDTATILNPLIFFINTSSGADSSWWDFGDGTSYAGFDTAHTYGDTGTYAVWLIVTDSLGCLDSIIQYVTIISDFILFAPNAFTPNDDGKNDVFIPKGMGIDINNFKMYIFDRWGDEIFETTDFFRGWDGTVNNGRKIAQQDVYIWLILTKDIHGKRHRYIGHVTLIR